MHARITVHHDSSRRRVVVVLEIPAPPTVIDTTGEEVLEPESHSREPARVIPLREVA